MEVRLCSSLVEYESLACVGRSTDSVTEYLTNLLDKGPGYYIDGFSSEFKLLLINKKIIPVVINDGKDKSCYLSALSIHYVKHGIDSVKEKIKNRLLYQALKCFGAAMNAILNIFEIDKAVYVNCWLIPTGASVYLDQNEIDKILEFFYRKYKSYAVIFKGVNNYLHLDSIQLPTSNCLTNRIVYTATVDEGFLRKTNIQKAIKAIGKTSYVLTPGEELGVPELTAIRQLYRQLYFGKHSRYSLSYTLNWFEMVRELNFFKLQAYKNIDHEIVAFTVTFFGGESMVSSLGACKVDAPDYFHLYTLNFAIRVLDAKAENKNLNYSSGGDEFKKNRGGIATSEYDLIYFDHLKFIQRSVWKGFISMCTRIIRYLNK